VTQKILIGDIESKSNLLIKHLNRAIDANPAMDISYIDVIADDLNDAIYNHIKSIKSYHKKKLN
jgi:hypothetical protein